MKGAIAIVLFLAVSVPSCDGQQACDYNRITNCTNGLTQTVFPKLDDNTIVCRAYNDYKMCVYGVPVCSWTGIIAELERQMVLSGVNFTARCPQVPEMTTRPWGGMSTTMSPNRTMPWTTRPSWGCSVYEINTCTNNLQMEYSRGMGCDAASNFMKCMNKLTACTGHSEFTRARHTFKEMGLEEQCPHVTHRPKPSGATTLSAMVSLTFALMALFWI